MNQRKLSKDRVLGALSAAVLVALPVISSAATFTWNGGDSTFGTMTTGDDWVGGSSPYTASSGTADLVFGSTNPHGFAPTMNGALDAHSLTFSSGALSYDIVTNGSGFSGILTLESTGLTDNAANAETISGATAVSLNATQPWTLAGGAFTDSTPLNLNTSVLTVNTSVAAASATFSGTLSGSGAASLTKSGPGSLLLSGSGSSSIPALSVQGGATQISSGTLTLTATASNPFNVSAGSLTINNSATVDASAYAGQAEIIDGSTGPSVTVSGGGSQLKFGTYVEVGYTNTASLTVQQSASVTAPASSILYVAIFGGSGTISIASGGSLTDQTVVLGDSVGSTGTVTVTGSGSTLTGTATIYLGGQSAAGGTGTLNLTNGGSAVTGKTEFESNTSSTNINGGTLVTGSLSSFASGNGAIALTDPAGEYALTINGSSGTSTYSGSISGTGSIYKSGGSTQNLFGTNTFTGTVLVVAGTLNMSSGSASEYASSTGGTLELDFANFGSAPVYSDIGGTVIYNTPTISGGILIGNGTHNVSAVNNYYGTTIDNGVSITPANNAQFTGVNSAGNITNPSGTSFNWDGGANNGGNLIISGTTGVASWTSSGTVQVNNGGALYDFDSNLVLLGGSRTYVGTSSVSGGTIDLANNGVTLELDGGLLVNYGSITGGTVDVNFGGLATGGGSYSSIVVNPGGTYSPGTYSAASPLPQGATSFAAIQPASSGSTDIGQTVTVNATAVFTVNGTDSLFLYNPGALTTNNNAVVKQGTGTLMLPAFATTSSLTVSAGTMQIAHAGDYPQVLQVGALTVSTGATLDLTAQSAVLSNTSLATVTSLLATGYNGGHWNGTGIISSTAAGTTNTALGAELNSNGSGPLLSTFEGLPVTSADVLIKYTYFGDANLDGVVNGSDYTLIDNGFNNKLTGWHNGDFNYDGTVNGDDYTLIDNAFNTQGPALTSVPAEMVAIDTDQIAAPSTAAIPEPGALGLLAFGVVGLLLPRQRNRRLIFRAR